MDWLNSEVDLIIADYFIMLTKELSGNPYNKTEHRNSLKQYLNNRTDGSIEFKHQNISAVLIKLGLPFIIGYKPKWNYQRILEDRIINFVSIQKSTIEQTFKDFVDSSVSMNSPKYDFTKLIEPAPERQIILDSGITYERRPIKINYLEKEQKNSLLGEKGEIFVLAYEKWRLINEGKQSLVDKIEWVAEYDNSAGFDILSKNIDGSDRYIEVKTTKLGIYAPIFFSKNEYELAKVKSSDYYLYRLFNFNQTPKMFNVNGNFDSFCTKEPLQYKGIF